MARHYAKCQQCEWHFFLIIIRFHHHSKCVNYNLCTLFSGQTFLPVLLSTILMLSQSENFMHILHKLTQQLLNKAVAA